MQYWNGKVPTRDDYGRRIDGEFIDGKTRMGPWAIMTPEVWKAYGIGSLGTGRGQRYRRDETGKYVKVEG